MLGAFQRITLRRVGALDTFKRRLYYIFATRMQQGSVMAKDATLHMKIDATLKAAAEKAAADDHRSLTSLVEKLLADYCREHGFLKSRPKR
jgi:hypothetical protein